MAGVIAGALDATTPAAGLAAPVQGFAGWFDLHATPAADGGWKRDAAGAWHMRGLSLEIQADSDCHVAIDGACIALIRGAPRFTDTGLQATGDSHGLATALLRGYQRDADAVLSLLRGRYAVCVIDRDERRVLLETDRFAVHPLCWARDGTRIAFAARVDQLPLRGTAGISPQALYDYLYFHMIPAPRTIYDGVQCLRVAERLTATAAGVDVTPHWRPVFARRTDSSLPELEARFRAILRGAVEREYCAGSTGAFLSGGTDSSTIAGLLRNVSGAPVNAYSIGFDAEGYDEMHFARLAARHFGLEHRAHYLTPSEMLSAIPALGAALEQPFGNSSVIPAYWCARLAAADGLTKVLAGDGGDELFGGNTRYAKQKVFDAYWRLPPMARAKVERTFGHERWSRVPLLRKVRSYVMQARVPLPARSQSYNLLSRLGPEHLLSPRFFEAVDAGAPARAQAQTWASTAADVALVDRMLAYDWQYTLADSDLPKVNAASTLANIDVGFPMLDDDLLDFSLELPATLKVRGLTLRYFFKRALRDFLPREVIRKRKHGFGMPFGVWLTQDERLGEFVDERLDSLSTRGLLKPEALRRLRSDKLAEHASYYGEMIWIALMLEEWLRAHAPGFRL